ncbi:prepilin-type N-terminal cleavage/methylation domain-containing protein [Effusibacillus pohliae]|uniref:prepilin-type N-terminal cleavage/methylation domain-containing protein n=1 Tax=Effusibacillus pohliae TaxID=232270 RepID=UPI00146149DE|nr:prepilin-type N-terminal cleavage/methylation domain-containing protein [Effusibacillus pohliae]
MSRWFPDQRGMTLTETVVGLFVLSLLLLAVTGWLYHWQRSAQVVENHVMMRTEIDAAFRILGEDVRTGAEILAVGGELVLRNDKDERIRYAVSNRGNLIRTVNGGGASVAATGVKKWAVSSTGTGGIEVFLTIERAGMTWEQAAILSMRRWQHE